MRTKNAKAITRAEAAHMARVKESGCAVCGAGGIVEAHHTKQGNHFTTGAEHGVKFGGRDA